MDVFGALASPVRRRLLEYLREGPRAAGDLAGRFTLSRPAVSEHLATLKRAHLVQEVQRGRHHYYHLQTSPLTEVHQWLHPFGHHPSSPAYPTPAPTDESDSIDGARSGSLPHPPPPTNASAMVGD